MKRLNNLPEITDEMLGGLHATQELKRDILRDAEKAARGERVRRSTPWQTRGTARPMRMAASLVCAAVLLCAAAFGIPGLINGDKPAPDVLISTQTAGDEPLTGGYARAMDMPRGSIVITQQRQPGYRGVWEAANGANFPLICVNGRYYRMMSHPETLSGDLLGGALGTVDTFTSEPALASGGVVSNAAAQGETVYEVRGMAGAAVAASVNGSLRVFQRVSFGASALLGGERLGDTLGASPVVALELSGVGSVTDPAQAQRLMQILLQNARMTRASAGETGQSLLIGLQNGLVLQMSVRDESLMACGTWSCPEFFEAFEEAMQ